MDSLFEQAFWEKAWAEADSATNVSDGDEAVEAWNRRAGSYDRNVGSESGNRRVAEVLAFLDAYGVLKDKLKILDLGCGPGNFTLALAERGHTVWALDPAEKMLEALCEKLQKRPDLAGRVNTVQADWVPLNLEDRGWVKFFDLVFASMTPGVKDVPTLNKAMQASRAYVYLSRFAGPRTQPSVEAIWHQCRGGVYFRRSLDILYPLNWLYAGGYRPAVHFSRWEREHRQPVEEAVQEISDILALRLGTDGAVREAVRSYVEKRAENGFFTERKGATSAMLLWHVEKKVLTLAAILD